MWILTPIGFFSIVQKPWDHDPGTLTIRARVRDDLVNLREEYLPDMGDIIESDDSDYRFRAQADAGAVAGAISDLTAAINYDNFKSEVHRRQGYERAGIYSEIWGVLMRLTRLAKPKNRLGGMVDATLPDLEVG